VWWQEAGGEGPTEGGGNESDAEDATLTALAKQMYKEFTRPLQPTGRVSGPDLIFTLYIYIYIYMACL
jgi:hypothetical protein